MDTIFVREIWIKIIRHLKRPYTMRSISKRMKLLVDKNFTFDNEYIFDTPSYRQFAPDYYIFSNKYYKEIPFLVNKFIIRNSMNLDGVIYSKEQHIEHISNIVSYINNDKRCHSVSLYMEGQLDLCIHEILLNIKKDIYLYCKSYYDNNYILTKSNNIKSFHVYEYSQISRTKIESYESVIENIRCLCVPYDINESLKHISHIKTFAYKIFSGMPCLFDLSKFTNMKSLELYVSQKVDIVYPPKLKKLNLVINAGVHIATNNFPITLKKLIYILDYLKSMDGFDFTYLRNLKKIVHNCENIRYPSSIKHIINKNSTYNEHVAPLLVEFKDASSVESKYFLNMPLSIEYLELRSKHIPSDLRHYKYLKYLHLGDCIFDDLILPENILFIKIFISCPTNNVLDIIADAIKPLNKVKEINVGIRNSGYIVRPTLKKFIGNLPVSVETISLDLENSGLTFDMQKLPKSIHKMNINDNMIKIRDVIM